MYISSYRRKTEAVFFFALLFLIVFIFRLVYIQIFRSNYLQEIAQKQHSLFTEIEPLRGIIYDCNFKPQALNLPADSLYAAPKMMSNYDKDRAVEELSRILGLSREYLRERMNRKKYFVWISRKITLEQAEAVKKLKIRHLGFIRESKRSYPNSYLEVR